MELIHKEEKQVASKHTKTCSVSHLVKEIKNYNYIHESIRLAKLKKNHSVGIGKCMRKWAPLCSDVEINCRANNNLCQNLK